MTSRAEQLFPKEPVTESRTLTDAATSLSFLGAVVDEERIDSRTMIEEGKRGVILKVAEDRNIGYREVLEDFRNLSGMLRRFEHVGQTLQSTSASSKIIIDHDLSTSIMITTQLGFRAAFEAERNRGKIDEQKLISDYAAPFTGGVEELVSIIANVRGSLDILVNVPIFEVEAEEALQGEERRQQYVDNMNT